MSEVSILLKKPAATTGLSLIYLQFKIKGGERLIYSTGHNIAPNLWHKERQCVKSNTVTTKDGLHYLNDLLKNLKEIIISSYRKESINGIPTVDQLKKYLDDFVNQKLNLEKEISSKPTLLKLFDKFIDNEIKLNTKDRSANTLKNYRSTLNHLKAFEKQTKYKISYESINLVFFGQFVQYFRDKSMKVNTIGKYITVLKTVMNFALENDFTTNVIFKKDGFKIQDEKTDAVYCSESDLALIYKLDLSDNKRLDQVRDTFIAACNLGLRYGDMISLKPENFQKIDGNLYVRKITEKTLEEVIIPCSHVLLQIFEKYKSSPTRLPPAITGVCFNRYIKEVFEMAGLTQKGRLLSQPDKPFHKCISSHTARRSFLTNNFISGFPPMQLMRISGHRTERAFLTYIKISNMEVAKNFNMHLQGNLNKNLLKAV